MTHSSILLISGSGLLGSKLHAAFQTAGNRVTATSRGGSPGIPLDLEKPVEPQLAPYWSTGKFTHGVIAAAMPDPEECRKLPEKSRLINVEANVALLGLFKEHGLMPVFFSTDLVFDCKGGLYSEGDPVEPSTLYARQKVEIEELIRNSFEHHLIFRLCKLMAKDLHPRNILAQVVHKIEDGQRYRAFQDQTITPVFAEDVAIITEQAIASGLSGTYHLAGKERFTRLELAHMVCREFGISEECVDPIQMTDMNFAEPRGPNHTLSSDKISKHLDFRFTPFAEGLRKMRQLKK